MEEGGRLCWGRNILSHRQRLVEYDNWPEYLTDLKYSVGQIITNMTFGPCGNFLYCQLF